MPGSAVGHEVAHRPDPVPTNLTAHIMRTRALRLGETAAPPRGYSSPAGTIKRTCATASITSEALQGSLPSSGASVAS